MVHLDLVAGLTQKEISIDYIRDKTCADGIITTRANLIRHAKERGLATVLRYFVLDSMALDNIQKLSQQGYASQPDVIEAPAKHIHMVSEPVQAPPMEDETEEKAETVQETEQETYAEEKPGATE